MAKYIVADEDNDQGALVEGKSDESALKTYLRWLISKNDPDLKGEELDQEVETAMGNHTFLVIPESKMIGGSGKKGSVRMVGEPLRRISKSGAGRMR